MKCNIKQCNNESNLENLGIYLCNEHKDYPLYKILDDYGKSGFTELLKENIRYHYRDNKEMLEIYNKEWE